MIWKLTKNFGAAVAFGLIPIPLMLLLWLPIVYVRNGTVSDSHDRHNEAIARNQFWTALTFNQPISDRDTENLRQAMEGVIHSSNPPAKLLGMPVAPNQWTLANDRLGGIVIDWAQDSSGYDLNYGTLDTRFALKTLQAKPATYRTLLAGVPGVKKHGDLVWPNAWLAAVSAAALVAFLVFVGLSFGDIADAVEERRRQRAKKRADVQYLASLGPRERRLVLAKREIEKLTDSAEKRAALKKVNEGLKIVRGESTVESDARLANINRDLDDIILESKTWQDTYRRLSS